MLDVMRNPPPVTETITWQATRVLMPDAMTDVLIFNPELEGDHVWEGYFDGQEWRTNDGWPIGNVVTWWAHKPAGPAEPKPGVPA